MNTANHITPDDLYLFALQLLPETEMQAAGLHLKECPLCRSQLGEIQGDLAGYAMTAEVQAPPSQLRRRRTWFARGVCKTLRLPRPATARSSFRTASRQVRTTRSARFMRWLMAW